MNKVYSIILTASLVMTSFISYAASCPNANLPSKVRYDYKTFSWTENFRVKNEETGEQVGNIKRVAFNFFKKLFKKGEIAGNKFEYLVDGEVSFYGEQVVKKLEDVIISTTEVKDCNDQTIGYVVETIKNEATQIGTEIAEELIKVLSEELLDTRININLSNMYSEYKILDANRKIIGKSESTKFINEQIQVTSTKNDESLMMTMKGFNFDPGDDWYIDFGSNESGIDNRIIALIPAFKSRKNTESDLSDLYEN